MNETIFFVEDDTTIHSLIKATLELNGYKAVGFREPLAFIETLKTTVPDLLILDLMLPNMSGYDVITYMKGNENYAKVPIVILSALSDELDVVKGLDNGASDYISKPFGVLEFISRIMSNLRKGKETVQEKDVFKVRNLVVDRKKFICTLNGKPVALTIKEFELLSLLVQNHSKVMSRSTLLKEIWGFDSDVATRTLDMHIKTIREKLAAITDEQYIVTIRAVGYVIYDEE